MITALKYSVLIGVLLTIWVFANCLVKYAGKLPGTIHNSNSVIVSSKVTLTENNLVVLNEEVTEQSVIKVLTSLYTKYDSKEPVYLFLDTPGGEVYAGLTLSEYLRGTSQNIICIAKQAQSMGFVILQSCKTRLVMDSTILMMHEIAGELQGYITLPQLRVELKEWEMLQDYTNRLVTDRIGISTYSLKSLMAPMWETYDGKIAVQENIADGVVFPVCSKDLYLKKISKEIPVTFMGTTIGNQTVQISACPL